MNRRFDQEEGVTVIFGTLMLILIIVVSASAMALFISQAQKEEMERQSHLNAYESENLLIKDITLNPNETEPFSTGFEAIDIDIQNMDINPSQLLNITITDQSRTYIPGYFTLKDSPSEHYTDKKRLRIDGKTSETVHLDFQQYYASDFNLSTYEPFTIKVYTSLYKTFEMTYEPPTPVIKFGFEQEDIGVGERAVLVLDGSDSFDDETISKWVWKVWKKDAYTVYNYTASGEIVRVPLPSKGPFQVNLTVQDNDGMTGKTDPFDIPENQMYSPPGFMEVSPLTLNLNSAPYEDNITVTIKDVDGENIGPGILVESQFIYNPTGNFTLADTYLITDSDGKVEFQVTSTGIGEGAIRLSCGKLMPISVKVKRT